jgi:SAM-dependent methyltransferase
MARDTAPKRQGSAAAREDAASYGEAFADVYDDWYADVSDTAAAVEALAGWAGSGAVLELGAGTGRLAIPLARRQIEVHGLDSSYAMLRRLRDQPDGDCVNALIGDMAELPLRPVPRFALVFAAFNTLCNLPTAPAQQRCIEGAAAVLAAGGRLVIEAVVPVTEPSHDRALEVVRAKADELVLMVSRADPRTQQVRGRHVHLRDGRVVVRPWLLRYLAVHELDAMATEAGLVLESRHGGWRGEPFDDASGLHVSVFARR